MKWLCKHDNSRIFLKLILGITVFYKKNLFLSYFVKTTSIPFGICISLETCRSNSAYNLLIYLVKKFIGLLVGWKL